jgi:hypothetical protein
MTVTATAQHDILTAQKIAKILSGSDGKSAGDRFGMRYVQQYLGYLPGFKPTLEWMVSERLVIREGAGRAGEGAKTLSLTDLGKAFLSQVGTGTRELRNALAFPPFVYELGSKAFMGFGLWCIENGLEPREVLEQFFGEKTSKHTF